MTSQPASGAGFYKGDWRCADFLIEEKATGKESLSVKLAWWKKIKSEAAAAGRRPMLMLRFLEPAGETILLCVSPEDWPDAD